MGEDYDEIFAEIKRGKMQVPSIEWDEISNDVKILIQKICSPTEKD